MIATARVLDSLTNGVELPTHQGLHMTPARRVPLAEAHVPALAEAGEALEAAEDRYAGAMAGVGRLVVAVTVERQAIAREATEGPDPEQTADLVARVDALRAQADGARLAILAADAEAERLSAARLTYNRLLGEAQAAPPAGWVAEAVVRVTDAAGAALAAHAALAEAVATLADAEAGLAVAIPERPPFEALAAGGGGLNRNLWLLLDVAPVRAPLAEVGQGLRARLLVPEVVAAEGGLRPVRVGGDVQLLGAV